MLTRFAGLFGQLRRRDARRAWFVELGSLARALRWVLPWAVLGRSQRDANPVIWLCRAAERHPDRIALSTSKEEISFGQLVAQTATYATQLSRQGLERGQRVAVVGTTSAELVRCLLACFWLGALPCLFDDSTPPDQLETQLDGLLPDWVLPVRGASAALPKSRRKRAYRELSTPSEGKGASRAVLPAVARWSARDTGLILPTSGTEGYPKLCKVSLGRLILAGHSFGGFLLQLRENSVIYCPLPLTHATALMVGLFPALVHGCTLHLGGRFSASSFFHDVASARGTHVIYVGELLRFVTAAVRGSPTDPSNIERFVGNGLDATTWAKLAVLCPQAQIVEFYGATELPAIIVNLAARAGAMGRVPFRAWSRFRVAQLPSDGSCSAQSSPPKIRECGPGELGELLIGMPRRKWPTVGGFEGYWDKKHEEKSLLRNVFVRGDCYYRTGDCVRFDRDDFFYFVDRVGDVWRSRGHNVSTSWVAQRLREGAGVADCLVIPVALDDSSMRFGLAVVVPDEHFVPKDLAARLGQLPTYARPQLALVSTSLATTTSFKLLRNPYRTRQFDPLETQDTVYWYDGELRVCDGETWPTQRARLLARNSSN